MVKGGHVRVDLSLDEETAEGGRIREARVLVMVMALVGRLGSMVVTARKVGLGGGAGKGLASRVVLVGSGERLGCLGGRGALRLTAGELRLLRWLLHYLIAS